MKRPIPVILSAILLALLALLQLALALSMIAAGVLFLHKGLPVPATPAPTPMPIPPSFLPVMMFAFSLFYAALATWSILTLIGLVRMRSWARYSILVIAGCITLFGAIATLTSIAMPFLMRSAQLATQPAPDPNLMRGAFLFMGLISGIFTAVAISQLVYYNLANTRAIFQQYAPVRLDPPNTSTGRPRPTAITVISWFFLISGPFMLIYSLLPIPAYVLGFVVNGIAARMVYATFALVTFAIGYGLFRLRSEARVTFIAWIIFGFFNMAAILTPWGSRNFDAYMQKFTYHNPAAPTPNLFAGHQLIIFSFLFATAINLFFLWLIHRHREAFTPAPPPPPMPILDAPFTG
jgi:hypothetical protein